MGTWLFYCVTNIHEIHRLFVIFLAVTSYNPCVTALDNMLRQQLQLTRDFLNANNEMHNALMSAIEKCVVPPVRPVNIHLTRVSLLLIHFSEYDPNCVDNFYKTRTTYRTNAEVCCNMLAVVLKHWRVFLRKYTGKRFDIF